ncbi:MAG: TonB-dependent receptor [Deltaproteobacteria bacterium]|nr:TonB-dependent receptor [Deltaproteobacteria bacterium]
MESVVTAPTLLEINFHFQYKSVVTTVYAAFGAVICLSRLATSEPPPPGAPALEEGADDAERDDASLDQGPRDEHGDGDPAHIDGDDASPPSDVGEQPSPPSATTESRATATSPDTPTPTRGPIDDATEVTPAAATTDEGARRVVVRSPADEMMGSAEAVEVVDLAAAQRQTADLGQVLSRRRGVMLRRAGGLGSSSDFALGGLGGAQVPFFVDGVPIEFSGFALDPANIPVGLVDRVEIYRGVVPIRFGADALGGAVNLARDLRIYGTRSSVSYQGGSFDTHRLLAQSSTLLEGPGLYAAAFGFLDHSRNDYRIDVEVGQPDGSLVATTLQRRHDRYLAGGGGITLGVVDRRWADRLLVTGFVSALDKELPHNVVMTVPYGGASWGEIRPGANLRYEKQLPRDLAVSVTAAFAQRRIRFTDTDHCVYDWYGRCVLEKTTAGELTAIGTDQRIIQNGAYGNLGLSWSPGRHALRLVIAPAGFGRQGSNALANADARDPLTARRQLFNLVTGLEYQVDVLRERLQSVSFVKDYVQAAIADRVVPGADDYPTMRRVDHELGAGQALRWRFTDWAQVKASYEWATRLPSVDELFGDGVLVEPNLELRPERSHNFNLGASVNRTTRAGRWWSDVLTSARLVRDAIAPIPEDNRISSQNVNDARALAVDAALGWTSPGRWVTIDGNVTFVDYRNASADGPFGPYDGDRMPARPWLSANAHGQLLLTEFVATGDSLALDWTTRYVHGFFRGWESAGTTAFKQRVPPQVLHGVGVSYVVARRRWEVATALAVRNLLDARAFDYVGVQLPGRAFQARVTVAF